jgi:hypothetical protein
MDASSRRSNEMAKNWRGVCPSVDFRAGDDDGDDNSLAINSEITQFLFPTLIPLSGVGTTCFSSCCDKDSAIIFTTSLLPDVNPP